MEPNYEFHERYKKSCPDYAIKLEHKGVTYYGALDPVSYERWENMKDETKNESLIAKGEGFHPMIVYIYNDKKEFVCYFGCEAVGGPPDSTLLISSVLSSPSGQGCGRLGMMVLNEYFGLVCFTESVQTARGFWRKMIDEGLASSYCLDDTESEVESSSTESGTEGDSMEPDKKRKRKSTQAFFTSVIE